MTDFYEALAEILEVNDVKADDLLRDFENWDSLTILSIVATLAADYGVSLSSADLRRVASVGELAAIVEERGRK